MNDTGSPGPQISSTMNAEMTCTANGRFPIWRTAFAMLLLVFSGGCRLLVKVDGLQCETDDQCVTLLDHTDAVCGTHGVCEVDGLQCETDDQCVTLLDHTDAVCGTHGVCEVDGLQCEADDQCATLLDDTDAVCGTHGVCEIPENPFPTELACLAKPPPKLVIDASQTAQLTLYIADFRTLGPPTGVTLRACGSRDVECESPLLEAVPVDGEGKAVMELPHGFSGYFETSSEAYLPTLFYTDVPLLEDTILYGPSLLSPALVQALASTGQEGIEEGTGVLIVDMADCDSNALAGVTASIPSSELTPFFFPAGLPDRELEFTHISTEVALHNTPRAIAGFSNVEPGYATVETHLPEFDHPFGTHTVIIRPDAMTFLRITAGAPR